MPACNVGAHGLFGGAFDHGVLSLPPRKHGQKSRHFACIALTPRRLFEHPAKFPAVIVIVVIDGVTEKLPLRIFRSIDERRIGKSRLL